MKFKAVFLIVFLAAASASAQPQGNDYYLEQPPEITVAKWLNARKAMSLKKLRRKKECVLLEFWATWCSACRKAVPKMNRWHEKYGKKLRIIAVTMEDPQKVANFIKDNKIEYAVAIDDDQKTTTAYGIRAIPYIYLIDDWGKVAWQGFAEALDDDRIEMMLRAARK